MGIVCVLLLEGGGAVVEGWGTASQACPTQALMTPHLLAALRAPDSEWLGLGENSSVPTAAADLRRHPQHQRSRPRAVPGSESCGPCGSCLPGGLRVGKRLAGPRSGAWR